MIDRFDLSLVLTHACNLACRYCYMGEHHSTWMDAAMAERAIELAMGQSNHVHLAFFGGEPLLAWDLMVSLAELARERAASDKTLTMQVTTNGTLVDIFRARRIRELGIEVAVSIDGPRAAHIGRPKKGGDDSFDSTVAGIAALNEAGVDFDIVAVTTPDNAGALAQSVEHLSGLGPRRIFLNPAFNESWSDEAIVAWENALRGVASFIRDRAVAGAPVWIDAFESKLASSVKGERTKHCSVGRANVAVSPLGHLYPCDRLVGDDRSDRFRIGHLDDGFASLRGLARGPADEECFECSERPRCRASCACANIAETNEPDLPGGVQCWYERALATIIGELGWELALGNTGFADKAYGDLVPMTTEAVNVPRKLPVVR